MKAIEISAKQALNRNKTSFTPYTYDLNIYRGCAQRCCYCYAIYSHKFLDDQNFYENIYYKSNIAEKLDEAFSKTDFSSQLVGVGTVCDSYQPIEKELELTRNCLKFFLKHGVSIYLSTKSELILEMLTFWPNFQRRPQFAFAFQLQPLTKSLEKSWSRAFPRQMFALMF